MDKDRIAAIAARGEEIKISSAEYLWICRGIRQALLPDKPVAPYRRRRPKPEQPDDLASRRTCGGATEGD